jgi:hypothetical protein
MQHAFERQEVEKLVADKACLTACETQDGYLSTDTLCFTRLTRSNLFKTFEGVWILAD